MKLTTKTLKDMVKKELNEMNYHSHDPNAGVGEIRQALFNIGLKAAHAGIDMQALQEALHEGYGHGQMEAEGDIEDEQTYSRGPYGEI